MVHQNMASFSQKIIYLENVATTAVEDLESNKEVLNNLKQVTFRVNLL